METPRHILDSEHDPRVLRDLAKMVITENNRLVEVIKQIQLEQAKQAQQKLNIDEVLKVFRKKYFGKKSEKSNNRERDRLNNDPELTVHSQNLLPFPKVKKKRALAEEERIHESTDEDLRSMSEALALANPAASQWEEVVGLFDKSTEIEIVERTYKKVLHKRKKYRLKKEFAAAIEKEVIVAAPGPVKLIPGALYSIDFATSVVVDKYLNHIPLERQCRMMDSVGLHGMSTQVLYNVVRISSEHLAEMAERIKQEILSHRLIHSDETRWAINNSKDSDGFMWIISNNAGSHYRFEPSRSGKVIKETLKGYMGYVMSDAYSGYYQFKDNLEQVLTLCHAHARRNFWDIQDDNPRGQYILDLWEELFKIEKLAKDFDELRELREQKSRPIIEKMKTWLWAELTESRPETLFKKAIEYCLRHWKELTRFLDDPIIPLSNNEAERSIRSIVMGRKNFYGSRSIDGADVAAIMYTIIESCKKVELDPRTYISITLRKLASGEHAETPYEMAKRQRQ